MQENRKAERHQYNVPAIVDFGDFNVFDAQIRNISSSGLLLIIDDLQVPPNDQFHVKFLLTGKSKALNVGAEVAWAKVERNSLYVGAKLVQADIDEILGYCNEIPLLREDRLI